MPKKILLADDSITIQKVVELTFSEGDYQVFAVGNGSQALRKIHEVRPDIALLDVIMPEANGYEVCEKVKGDPATSRIPVLLLTGTFEPFDKNRAQAAGADGHLTKPFESQVLIARVEELIATAAPAAAAAPVQEPAAAPPAPPDRRDAPPAQAEVRDEFSTRIVPDRYDDEAAAPRGFDSEEDESVQTIRLDAEDPRPPSPSEEASAGTWDELASGLSSAPIGSRSEAEERVSAAVDSTVRSSVAEAFATEARGERPSGEARDAGGNGLSTDQVERIASRVVEKLSDRVVREIAWEVIPEIAENLIRQRIRELEDKISREG